MNDDKTVCKTSLTILDYPLQTGSPAPGSKYSLVYEARKIPHMETLNLKWGVHAEMCELL